ncbi:hypothetical protein EQM13_07300 [Acidilutibacter cellobiosedens]|jgi:hypothetical protein|uniref:Uncharacterized protein n=1 Tax=Acidilutibacter cellobiosedens TaxID=2507161 RepID=A0A410QBL9_9FIRM|nr:hypothetical protein [Acidilutibacter cellobiosedens]QAT61396.1 hypothetical protein EQM13_07300 [Acidilutibacter cellobiosedens]
MKPRAIFYTTYIFLTGILLLITAEGICFFNKREFQPEYNNFSEQYIKIKKNTIEQLPKEVKSDFYERLNALILKDKGKLLFYTINGAGLGVIDDKSYYKNEMVEGEYFDSKDFTDDNKIIIAIKDSYFANIYKKRTKKVIINGDTYIIKGIIKGKSFINLSYGNNIQFIYPYKLANQVSGIYYIDLADKNNNKEITKLFNNHMAMRNVHIYSMDYINITIKDKINSFWEYGRGLRFFVMGLIFSIFNGGIYIYWDIIMDKKIMKIHYLLGVTRRKYFIRKLTELFIYLLIASLLAESLYCLMGKLRPFYASQFTKMIVKGSGSFYGNFKGIAIILIIIYMLIYSIMYFIITRNWETLWEER